MKKIFIIGSGELGSRHLQSLKNIKTSLEIYIIDPSNKSLKIAQERYDFQTSIERVRLTDSAPFSSSSCRMYELDSCPSTVSDFEGFETQVWKQNRAQINQKLTFEAMEKTKPKPIREEEPLKAGGREQKRGRSLVRTR